MGTIDPSSSRHLSLRIRSGIHTVFALDGIEAISISVQFHVQVTSIMFCPCIRNPEFEKYQCQMYPIELEIKDMTETTLLLLASAEVKDPEIRPL